MTNFVEIGHIVNYNADVEIKLIYKNVREGLNSKKLSYVRILGKRYMPGTIIITDVGDEEPTFGKIINIYEICSKVYFHVNIIEDVEFDTYYFAHKVIDEKMNPSKEEFICIHNLPDPEPCILAKNGDGTYIAMRYH